MKLRYLTVKFKKVKTVKPNMLLPYFYSRIPATTAAVFYRKFYGIYFYSVAGNSL